MTDLLIRRHATFARSHTLRLTLTRAWEDDLRRVCFIGHNPSTADHEIDDPTVRRWMHFASAWGYGGFVAVNLYPIRASNPVIAQKWADSEKNGPDWFARDDLMHNLEIVSREAKGSALVVACWSAIANDENWIDRVTEEIVQGIEPWPDIHVFGLTKSGAPIHPMARGKHRVSDDTMPILWRRGARHG
jgi:hypothetical protein